MAEVVSHVNFKQLGELNNVRIDRLPVVGQEDEVAPRQIQLIQRLGYTASFAGQQDSPLTQRGIERRFDPTNQSKIDEYTDAIRSALREGTQYWLATSEELGAIGFIKTSPSLSRVQRFKTRNDPEERIRRADAYVNDITVVPDAQRQHIGSALLYSAIKLGGTPPDKLVVASVYTESDHSVKLFGNLGFNLAEALPPVEIGPNEYLQQARFDASTAERLTTTLEERIPDLADREVFYRP